MSSKLPAVRLAFKVALALVLAITSVQVFYGFLRVRREAETFEQDSAKDQIVLGRALALTAAGVFKSRGPDDAAALVENADADYTHVAIHWLATRDIPTHRQGAAVTSSIKAPGAITWVTPDSEKEEGRVVTVMPVVVDGATVGAVRLSESLAEKSAYVRMSIERTVWSTAVTLGASFAGILMIGLFLVGRPIRVLVEAARRAGEGDLTHPIRITQNDEIGQLASELNGMFDKLREGRERLDAESAARIATLEQLRHADRLMTVGKLASGIAHELGTPLNVVLGRSKMIASDPEVGQSAARNAQIIGQQVERMTIIIRQLLDFARQRGPDMTSADVGVIVDQTIELLRPMAKKCNVSLRVTKGDEVSHARVDSGQLQQAFTNVIVNGMQAMPSGGELHVELDVAPRRNPKVAGDTLRDTLCVAVHDEGTGIAEEHLSCLFDPFFTTKDVGQGTGLGLSVTHGIVEEHRGWITVDSEVGKGTTFSICIPVETK